MPSDTPPDVSFEEIRSEAIKRAAPELREKMLIEYVQRAREYFERTIRDPGRRREHIQGFRAGIRVVCNEVGVDSDIVETALISHQRTYSSKPPRRGNRRHDEQRDDKSRRMPSVRTVEMLEEVDRLMKADKTMASTRHHIFDIIDELHRRDEGLYRHIQESGSVKLLNVLDKLCHEFPSLKQMLQGSEGRDSIAG